MAIGRIPEPLAGIQESILDAKGDLVTATAADTPARLAVGTNNQTLVADSTQSTGLKYANGSIATLTAKGDLLTATAANTIARLGVGANGTTLVADSAEATGLKWATPAGGGKVLQVVSAKYSTETTTSSTNTFVDSGLEATITLSSTSSRVIIMTVCKYINTNSADQNGIVAFRYTRNGTEIFKPFQPSNLEGVGPMAREVSTLSYIDSPSSTSALTYKLQGLQKDYISSPGRGLTFQQGGADSSMILMEIGA